MKLCDCVIASHTASSGVLLAAESVNKSYGGVPVLRDVDIAFNAGEVHALLGENGAGKSTLVKVIAGIIAADSGSVVGPAHVDGDIAMVFQELSVVPEMSVLDNLVLAARSKGPFVPYRRLRATALDALSRAGLANLDLGSPVATLSLAKRQLLEIARGLMVDAKVLILDEPTATLSDVEIDRVHGVIKELVAGGHSIVYITHRLGEVFSLADRITIMRAGKVAASGTTSEFEMKDVVANMLGADHVPGEKRTSSRAATATQVSLVVEGLGALGQFEDVSFEATSGSILALFGQVGSGADDLVKALVGLTDLSGGTATLRGEELSLRSRHSTQRDGIAYVSADRVTEGVFLNASVTANVSSGALGRVSDSRIIRRLKELSLAKEQAAQVSLDATRVKEPAYAFSGGNQQKIAVARALATKPSVLVLNEPTRGVDIGARSEIYRSIRRLLDDDVIVVVYSSDIVEIRELADRVITMYRGDVVEHHWVDDIDDASLITEILNGRVAA
jgi:ABC-type sugar transport system ATPase subunit